jgi:hypothetical protein
MDAGLAGDHPVRPTSLEKIGASFEARPSPDIASVQSYAGEHLRMRAVVPGLFMLKRRRMERVRANGCEASLEGRTR